MNRRGVIGMPVSVVLGLTLLSAPAASQQNSLKSQLVGTWTIVATSAAYGPTPKGMLIFDADGHFSFILMRSDLPEYASKNRVQGTAAEYQATVEGSLAYYGNYAVSGTDLDMYVEASTFPNLNGTDQKRINVTIIGDELKYTQPTPSGGGLPAPNVWKRTK
jgi:hypothetical protein